jgi:DNA-directed RNA polymerase specialized sigma24 family protein
MAVQKPIGIELLKAERAKPGSGRRRRKVAETDAMWAEIVPPAAEGVGTQHRPLSGGHQDKLKALERVLADLDANEREGLLLVALQGLPYQEAAQAARCPVGTMKSRMFCGRGRLLSWLSDAAGRPRGADRVAFRNDRATRQPASSHA